MERYENLELEIIAFENEDVIVTSVLGPIVHLERRGRINPV